VAQQEIIKAEKLASVGRLAAGIAHEIGNPIGIVFGYLDLLKQDDLNEAEKDDFLKRIEIEVQRINSIIRQLLDLARTKEIKPRPMALHPVIEDIVKVMAVQPLTADIDIRATLGADKDMVWGNEDQLRQVFLNLLLNAADAIRSGPDPASGAIVVSTANVDKEGGSPSIDITVSDNGPGIDAQQLGNIFDPFYTTKEPGKGTGLGLAVSYMIIDGLGGRISANRMPQGGAAFTISLRCADAGPKTTQQAEAVD
jgi:two-component system NtrC family sensor kinase